MGVKRIGINREALIVMGAYFFALTVDTWLFPAPPVYWMVVAAGPFMLFYSLFVLLKWCLVDTFRQ